MAGNQRSEADAADGAEHALDDIEAVTPVLTAQPFVDRSRIAVGGQSRGGIMSVARSGRHPEVRAVVNFVGGWMNTRLCRQGFAINLDLFKRGVSGGPSLWLYGDKDLFYPLKDTKAEFDAFLAAGGKGIWHDYEPPDTGRLNGHQINQASHLCSVDMEAYLAGRGLPSGLR